MSCYCILWNVVRVRGTGSTQVWEGGLEKRKEKFHAVSNMQQILDPVLRAEIDLPVSVILDVYI